MTLTYLGVGSNVEPEKYIRLAFAEVKQLGELRASAVYQCAPVGFDGNVFYNLVFELKTDLTLEDLQQQLRAIELKLGRAKDATKFQNRTVDVDILLFGESVSPEAPVLPRSDIYKYEFVLKPLFELCPDLVVPNDGRTVKELWEQFDSKGSLTAVELDFE
ncbi:MAG: 2-amino-4-hydroxy-6-hydroxymethyldihydropteridine diphosphokinase [Vibrio sp.]